MIKFKIVVLGQAGTGKTSIIKRYIYDAFEKKTSATINPCAVAKLITFPSINQTIQLTIWDTAGQQRFNALAPIYYKNSDAAILVYDVTNKKSLTKVEKWIEELDLQFKQKGIFKCLVGNKIDCIYERQVSYEQGKQKARYYNIQLFQVTALQNLNIKNLFEYIAQNLYNSKILNKSRKLQLSSYNLRQYHKKKYNCYC